MNPFARDMSKQALQRNEIARLTQNCQRLTSEKAALLRDLNALRARVRRVRAEMLTEADTMQAGGQTVAAGELRAFADMLGDER